MRRSALLLALSAASLFPVAVARAEALLDLADYREGMTFSRVDFGASETLHRAWAVVHYTERVPCQVQPDNWCDADRPVRVQVRGLSYDAAKKQVVYTEPGHEPIVCAALAHHSSLVGGDRLDATGNCTARIVNVTETVDDGFAGTKVTHEDVVLTVKEQPPRDNAVAAVK